MFCVLVKRCLHALEPEYLSSVCTLVAYILSRQRLRSAAGACLQGWAQGSFVEAEVNAERSRQRRGKAVMSLTEARQGRGRQLEAEARQTKFEARPRRGDPLKKIILPLDV